jgi:cytochrome P450
MTMLDADRTVAVDLMSPDLLQDWRSYATRWATEPPFYVGSLGFPQVITGSWADARSVLLDRDRFTALTPAGHPLGLFDIFRGLPQLNAMEGESHDRVRRLMMPFFSGAKVAEVAERIERLVAEMLDAIDAAGGEFDAMADLAEPLVERTLLEIVFSVEPEQQREFTAYSRAMPLVLQPTPEMGYQPAFVEQFERTTAVIEELLEDRRHHPRGDLITTLVSAKDDGFAVTHDELVGNVLAVYAGAQLATATSIGVLAMNLGMHPHEYARVRANPQLVPSAVDESLRYHPAGLFGFPRYALVDTESRWHARVGRDGAAGRAGIGQPRPREVPRPQSLRRDARCQGRAELQRRRTPLHRVDDRAGDAAGHGPRPGRALRRAAPGRCGLRAGLRRGHGRAEAGRDPDGRPTVNTNRGE